MLLERWVKITKYVDNGDNITNHSKTNPQRLGKEMGVVKGTIESIIITAALKPTWIFENSWKHEKTCLSLKLVEFQQLGCHIRVG